MSAPIAGPAHQIRIRWQQNSRNIAGSSRDSASPARVCARRHASAQKHSAVAARMARSTQASSSGDASPCAWPYSSSQIFTPDSAR
ncbi:hypothetical protein ACFS32_17965 [Novosphingobium pokkalii]|uniref:hypothetical protein n=1 Tax=Novosphingobium pokkalii TaxID=1770194 RepID=UPI00363A4F5B